MSLAAVALPVIAGIDIFSLKKKKVGLQSNNKKNREHVDNYAPKTSEVDTQMMQLI